MIRHISDSYDLVSASFQLQLSFKETKVGVFIFHNKDVQKRPANAPDFAE